MRMKRILERQSSFARQAVVVAVTEQAAKVMVGMTSHLRVDGPASSLNGFRCASWCVRSLHSY